MSATTTETFPDQVAAEAVARALSPFDYGPEEHVSVLLKRGDETAGYRLTPAEVAALVGSGGLDHTQLWCSVSVVTAPGPGRGTAADVIRVPGLWADLDVKPGGLPDWDAARAVVETLADMLGTDPAVLVNSGHGLQPRWVVEPDDSTDLARMSATTATVRGAGAAGVPPVRRFGRFGA